jgi:LPS export ABC transporter protein LptC
VTSFGNYIKLSLRRGACPERIRRVHRSFRYSASLVPSCFAPLLYLVPCALCLALFFSSCENDERVLKALTEKVELKEEAKTIESYLSQSGKIKAKLIAPLMYRHQRDTIMTEFPNTLHVDFYDDSLNTESWLFAKYGIYYDNLNKVFLRDSVVVINLEGDTLRTPELWWDQSSGKFYTDKPARLDGKDKHITGNQGLDATQDLKIIQFKYPTGPFNVKEGQMPR